ncbi:flagellar assembly protein FliW [Paenibacillus alginolyticus]|uniref:Flagellar assembly factor FliW n=1 Tax=Paenibacillus alginolyticus TaxID=59839 RepID=A0ABT4GIU5_9BACL|nr:flagellar assembly protein FliW [Paenibacillus alginolyticus]MCY9696124.1 flagellar assembly protein FliW [Paenibacillus alginolyticus]MEC0143014.1 flagellar assembly protein FliW [Paenibacillus alginolyticus]
MVQEITFVRELPGFKELKSFTLDVNEDNAPFANLQSSEQEKVGFIVANPFHFFPDYQVDLPEDIVSDLQIASTEHVRLWGIITYRSSLMQSTMNLQAPIVVNIQNGQAAQVIFSDSQYQIRQPLLPAGLNQEQVQGGTEDACVNAKKG